MAALVTGLIPILRTAVDSTSDYKCRNVWFGFLCIRLVTLFLAELAFTKLDADFTCNGTKNTICTKDCYNRWFHKPLLVAWNFIFMLAVMSVLLMELFTSHLRSMAQKKSSQAKTDVELQVQGKEETLVASNDPKGRTMLDFHRNRSAVGIYLLSIVLRVLVEAWFVYVLLSWNLPALSNGPYECRTNLCPELHVCVVSAAPEKRTAVYALASLSGMVLICSVLFCLYSIAHYLCGFKYSK